MISRLKVKGGITMPFQDKEKGFQYPSDIDIEFTKGLNVIVGPKKSSHDGSLVKGNGWHA